MSGFVILNGFDRSGSSAISRTLAKHPDVELIMQPFNSGFVRREMYIPLEKSIEVEKANWFFTDLSNNRLNNDLIESHWHLDYSTTKAYIPGKLHLVKTTINHLAQRFMKEGFPKIDVWGIWRNPYDIMHSIQKNDFQTAWYADALEKLKPTVFAEPLLHKHFAPFFEQKLSLNQELALLIAVRSYFFFYYLDADKLIVYEEFKKDANKGLKAFANKYQLKNFNFSTTSIADMNIIGKKYDPDKKDGLRENVRKDVELIFQPLFKLYQSKFQA